MAAARDGAPAPKGVVIPYDTLFPPSQAQRSLDRVLSEIADHQNQLLRLRHFAADNAELLNLVRTLPNELSHDIMVPFGKAAFFPGQLIHTNEFLVLLGEGYYAEQTAKQTAGVLMRRGKVLEEKMEAENLVISDLKARAEIYDTTFGESVKGVMEIREYEEPEQDKEDDAGPLHSDSLVSSKDNAKKTITDEEYSQILEGLDKLERAELAAESIASDDEDGHAASKSHPNIENNYLKNTVVQRPKSSESPQMELIQTSARKGETSGIHLETCISAQSSASIIYENPYLQSNDQSYQTIDRGSSDSKRESRDDPLLKAMGRNLSVPLAFTPKDNIKKEQVPKDKESVTEAFTTNYSHSKAFTGDIVEHGDGLDSKPQTPVSSQATSSKPSRPVSRFKMQKGR